jgi:hypothetical protein
MANPRLKSSRGRALCLPGTAAIVIARDGKFLKQVVLYMVQFALFGLLLFHVFSFLQG